MYARATLFEIDMLRSDVTTALAQFQQLVLPELRQQPGYRGVYAMTTEEGKGLLLSLWDTREAVEGSLGSGFYAEQVGKFVSVFRETPGREHYEVNFQDVLAAMLS
jgi:heme-degrading monooxygenase HmoA